jgi:CBS domain-containing protein
MNGTMEAVQTTIEPQVIELVKASYEAFCVDISGMFGIDMKCESQEATKETIDSLKKKLKKTVAVNVVEASGRLNGKFQILLDQEGLFILGGTIVMMPEKIVLENLKLGASKIAQSMIDAINETGNLLIGTWGKVFREGYEGCEPLHGHKHFTQKMPAFVGMPWDNPKEKIDLPADQELLFVSTKITIGKYPPFISAAIFSKSIFEAKAEEPKKAVEEKADIKNEEKKSEQAVKYDNPIAVEAKPVSEAIKQVIESPAALPGKELSLPNIIAKDLMSKDIIWAKSDESVQQAIDKMEHHNIAYLLVGQDSMMEGIISRADIAGAVSPYLRPLFSKWKRPLDDSTLHIKLKWIMSRPVYTVGADASFGDILKKMCGNKIRCLPVVDNNGKVLGIITVFDLFNKLITN